MTGNVAMDGSISLVKKTTEDKLVGRRKKQLSPYRGRILYVRRGEEQRKQDRSGTVRTCCLICCVRI